LFNVKIIYIRNAAWWNSQGGLYQPRLNYVSSLGIMREMGNINLWSRNFD
jgi:hypothetical protein